MLSQKSAVSYNKLYKYRSHVKVCITIMLEPMAGILKHGIIVPSNDMNLVPTFMKLSWFVWKLLQGTNACSRLTAPKKIQCISHAGIANSLNEQSS